MQLRITSRWPFIKKENLISTAKPPQPLPTITPSGKWYQNITELPLSRFIDVTVDGNVYALVISGKPTLNDLETTWENISTQYSDAMGDSEHQLYLSLYKEIHILTATYKSIFDIVEILRGFPHEGLKTELNSLVGTSFKFDYADPEKYHNELDRCLKRSKGLKIQLDLKLKSFEAISAKFKDNAGKPTREYFYSVLITLEDYSKVRLDENITVFQFCERVKRLNKHIKSMEKKK